MSTTKAKPKLDPRFRQPLSDEEIETLDALNRTWRELEFGEEADLLIEADQAMEELYGQRDSDEQKEPDECLDDCG